MSNRNFTIYQSSAGSGKTYTLAREYLKLAFQNPTYYKHILAVTFTNKAMQEMKNRIIQKLHEFSSGAFDAMAMDLMAYLELDESAFQKKSGELLSKILHGYSHFSVSTIDSFFQKVLRSFSRELGLAGSYRLELDYDLILIQIVNDLLIEVEDNENLRKWLIRFTLERLGDGKSWDIQKELRGFAKELFKEELQDIEHQILLKNERDILKFLDRLNRVVGSFEQKMDLLGKQGKEIMMTHGLNEDDFLQKKSGVANYFNKIQKGKYAPKSDNTKSKGRVYEALEDDKWYAAKSPKRDVIEMALDNGLRATLKEAVGYFETEHERYNTAQVIRKFIYGYGLLSDLARKLQEYKNEHDVMLIADATRFLRNLVRDTDAPFVYEKVGSFFNHYLIDEFQDTSTFQWESFRPLIENSLAEGKHNLLVGDVKQSIYRWRGGDLDLLRKKVVDQIGVQQAQVLQLDNNFRSEAIVIRFNNALFQDLPGLFNQSLQKSIGDQGVTVNYFQDVYQAAHQQIPPHREKSPKGYVRIGFFEDEEDYRWTQKVNEVLPGMLEALQDQGIPLRETAILVRENKEGKAIADLLMAHQHKARPGYRFDVVSNESLFLSSSPAVNTLIAALEFLQDPKDAVNRAELAYNFMVRSNNEQMELHDLFSAVNNDQQFEKFLPSRFAENQQVFLSTPLFELIEKLIDIFSLNEIAGQFAYLQTFQDQVLKFISQEKADLHSFLIWWDETGHKQSIKVADDLDAIKILTIHKAKGLEFHSVIIPYGNWSLDHKISPIIWNKTDRSPFNVGPLPLRYSKNLADTFFKTDYFLEMSKAYLDSLNTLYVALTRAANNLILYAPKKELRRTGVAEVLYSMISDEKFVLADHWQAADQTFEYGNLTAFEGVHDKGVERIALKEYVHFEWRDKITVRPSTQLLEEVDERKSRISYGNLVHRILSKVNYIDDVKHALDMIYFEESLSISETEALRKHLRSLLKDPEVRKWFTKEWHVKNEATILTTESEYRPDRVIWKGQQAVVIDYKTGDKKKEYESQVQRYAGLLEDMGYGVSAYLWYLKDGEIVPC